MKQTSICVFWHVFRINSDLLLFVLSVADAIATRYNKRQDIFSRRKSGEKMGKFHRTVLRRYLEFPVFSLEYVHYHSKSVYFTKNSSVWPSDCLNELDAFFQRSLYRQANGNRGWWWSDAAPSETIVILINSVTQQDRVTAGRRRVSRFTTYLLTT